MIQGEGDCYWAVKTENFGVSAPSVDMFVLDYETDSKQFIHFAKYTDRITSFVLSHMTGYLYGSGGAADMKSSFEACSKFGDITIFEKPNIIALFRPNRYSPDSPDENTQTLTIKVWKKLSKKENPNCLNEYLQGGGSFYGMFIPE